MAEQAAVGAPWATTASLVTPRVTGFVGVNGVVGDNIAVNHRGDILVAWRRIQGRDASLEVIRRRPRARSFEAPVTLAGAQAFGPSVSIADSGAGAVGWALRDTPSQLAGTSRGALRWRCAGRARRGRFGRKYLVAWMTTNPGYRVLASSDDEVHAAVRRAGSSRWEPSPRLGDTRYGRFLSVDDVSLRHGRAVVVSTSSQDVPSPNKHFLASRDRVTGTWRTEGNYRFSASPISASPSGVLLAAPG